MITVFNITLILPTFAWWWVSMMAIFHPFHVSISTIHFSEEDKSLQITMKIFADDLEESLNDAGSRQSAQTYVDILNPQDPEAVTQQVAQYLQSHFEIKVNNKPVQARFLGYELEEFAMWCYLEAPDISALQTIEVRNTVLTERFDDQVNIVNVQYLGNSKSTKLASNKVSDVISF